MKKILLNNKFNITWGAVPLFLSFFCFLLYFVFNTGWYEPARLVIKGISLEQSPLLTVQWDSGSGFNSYEQNKFPLNISSLNSSGIHKIKFRALGEKDPNSLGSDVELNSIRLDGKAFNLANIFPKDILRDRLAIHLNMDNQTYQLETDVAEHIQIEMASSFYFGKVEISIDDFTQIYDMYSGNKRLDIREFDFWIIQPDGQFTLTMDVPRYPLERLKLINETTDKKIYVTSVELITETKREILHKEDKTPLTSLAFINANKKLKRYFHPVQFVLQCIFSFLSTWIIYSCYNFVQDRGGLIATVFEKKRYVFWVFFIGAMLCYSVWLIAFWPGVMSIDSLKIWRAAMLPGVFINDHPVLNVIFYMFLMHIWNNVAVVPVFQIMCVSLLISFVFFSIYRNGIALIFLLPFYVLVIFSIPVALYNVMLWKDVPFALLVVFWGITLVFLNLKRQEGKFHLSFQMGFVLFLLYLALGLFRHNGLIYLAIVPCYFVLLQFVNLKKILVGAITCFLLIGSLFFILQNSSSIGGSQFLYLTARSYMKQISQKSIDKEMIRTATDYFDVFDMGKAETKSDKFHYYIGDRYAYKFLKTVGWDDVYPYVDQKSKENKLKDLLMQIYHKTYDSPWKYFVWNPKYMLYCIPFFMLLFRWLPNTALYCSFLFSGSIILVFLNTFNWRYYYFLYFGLYFILPLVLLDLRSRQTVKKMVV